MANRIEERLADCQRNNEKAFITYLTAGLGGMDTTLALVKAQEDITDIIELGIPFSDPTADGPVIQQASFDAINEGASLSKTFDLVAKLRDEGSSQPIIFMMYYNTILNVGLSAFAEKCHTVGVDGVIVPDLPLEEQDELLSALNRYDTTILIQLVSPVSKNRIADIVQDARGFIYCVSAMGVTGQNGSFHKEIIDYLNSVKSQSKIPVMMGFGIRQPADIEPMRDIIDGAIVGTHFIKLVRESNYSPKIAQEYAEQFKRGLNS